MTSKIIKVNLTRTYEYDVSEIQAELIEAGYNIDEIDNELLEDTARTVALEDFSCEMGYFEENINDFVGATAEIIE